MGYVLLLAAGVVVVCTGEEDQVVLRNKNKNIEIRSERGRGNEEYSRDIENNISNDEDDNDEDDDDNGHCSNENNDNDDNDNLNKQKINFPGNSPRGMTERSPRALKESSPYSSPSSATSLSSSIPNFNANNNPMQTKKLSKKINKNMIEQPNLTSSTSSLFPIIWPTQPNECVMACFSHSSSLDAFIISAVLPVWNHALVSTEQRQSYSGRQEVEERRREEQN